MSHTPSGRTLSEAASKALLAHYGVPFAAQAEVADPESAVAAAGRIGGPVVLKLCGDRIAHKTERGLVRLRVLGDAAVRDAAAALRAAATPEDGDVSLLVAPMVTGARELIAGVVRDPQFGPNVMLGVGGVLAEAVADVVFRPVPISRADAAAMIDQLRTRRLLEPFRGEAAVDRDALAGVLLGLSAAAAERADIASIDVNPLIVTPDGAPVAVDALVELDVAPAASAAGPPGRSRYTDEQFRALFEPRGVVVAGASAHPGKFGFVALHNLLASGYPGAVFATNLQGDEVLGIRTVTGLGEVPAGAADLLVVCTPASANEQLLRDAAARGIGAAFVTTAGYGESGEQGRIAQQRLVAVADEVGILLAGPNGQGLVSPPAGLCAQIVAPYPPAGSIAVVSQSGNFVSSFLNYARQTGVGISRAISAGNAAALDPTAVLSWYATDPATSVSLAYVEGVTDGRALLRSCSAAAAVKPLVVVKGGATSGGARAAASHTGALGTDDAIFDGVCRQAGVTRAATIEEAFEIAATFATQPLPAGPDVVVLTTVGGWGVVTSDAIHAGGLLRLIDLPADLGAAIDGLLPPRWSRNNPIDLAGGETRDTVPELLDLVAGHPAVDAVILLGLGIQSNQARLMRDGPFYPDHGLARIVEYHERQDRRYAEAAAAASDTHRKPVLVCTELAVADPANPGPAAVRATGRVCYPSGNRAVTALEQMYRYTMHRRGR